MPEEPIHHVLTGLPPETSYTLTVTQRGHRETIDLSPGPGLTANAAGVLAFATP